MQTTSVACAVAVPQVVLLQPTLETHTLPPCLRPQLPTISVSTCPAPLGLCGTMDTNRAATMQRKRTIAQSTEPTTTPAKVALSASMVLPLCDVWVWASALQPHTHTLTHSLSPVLVVVMGSMELKTSRSRMLIL